MSNPLLHPNDPRFQQPDVRDAAGKNRFADENAPADPASATNDTYAASASDGVRPFVPQYAVQQASRAILLLFLGGIGWGAAVVGALSFTGWFDVGWLGPILEMVPPGPAWLMAHEELKAIRAGVISTSAEPQARHAFWLGL